MQKALVLILLASVLGGCARGRWDLPTSMSHDEAMKEAYDCQFKAQMVAKGHGYMTGAVAESQMRDCLQSRGFRWVPEQRQQ